MFKLSSSVAVVALTASAISVVGVTSASAEMPHIAVPGNTIIADVDGDNRPDNLRITEKRVVNVPQGTLTCGVQMQLSKSKKTVTHDVAVRLSSEDPESSACPGTVQVADFDGDGIKSAVLAFYGITFQDVGETNAMMVSLTGAVTRLPIASRMREEMYSFADVNGDGRSDVMVVAEGGIPGFQLAMSRPGVAVPTIAGAEYQCGRPFLMDVDKSTAGLEILAALGPNGCEGSDFHGVRVYRHGVATREISAPIDRNTQRPGAISLEDAGDFNKDNIFGDLKVQFLGLDTPMTVTYLNDGKGHYRPLSPVSGPLIARNDAVEMQHKHFEKADINVLRNDVLPEGAAVTVKVTRAPKVGTAVPLPNGRIRYDRTGKGMARDVFEYTITDQRGRVSKATVRITVKK